MRLLVTMLFQMKTCSARVIDKYHCENFVQNCTKEQGSTWSIKAIILEYGLEVDTDRAQCLGLVSGNLLAQEKLLWTCNQQYIKKIVMKQLT